MSEKHLKDWESPPGSSLPRMDSHFRREVAEAIRAYAKPDEEPLKAGDVVRRKAEFTGDEVASDHLIIRAMFSVQGVPHLTLEHEHRHYLYCARADGYIRADPQGGKP